MFKRLVVFILCFGMACAINACALGESVNVTPLPSVTLPPPPALNLEGSCEDTKSLEIWLQVTTVVRDNFQATLNAAAGKDKAGMFTDIASLAALRDSVFAAATPDCAAETSMKLGDTMSQAVSALQAYLNGNTADLGDTITTTNAQLDEVKTAQDALIERMNTQIQQQRQVTPTA